MHFVVVKESQIPLDQGIYSSVKNSALTAVRGGHLSIEGIRNGYLFCQKLYVKA